MLAGMKVGSSQLGTFSSLGGQSVWTPSQVGRHPMSVLLFGKRPPKLVDRRKHPKLGKTLRKLEYVKDELAGLVGREGKDFTLELCEGDNASISRDGQIAFGVELLEEHADNDDLLVAVLGHEIGHRPWTWPRTLDPQGMTKAKLDALYREEEAKADRFAGRVLAELGASPDAICKFLEAHEAFEAGKPPSDYYPAEVRARIIRESYQRRAKALERKQALKQNLLGERKAAVRELR
jgi:hypothetical protein